MISDSEDSHNCLGTTPIEYFYKHVEGIEELIKDNKDQSSDWLLVHSRFAAFFCSFCILWFEGQSTYHSQKYLMDKLPSMIDKLADENDEDFELRKFTVGLNNLNWIPKRPRAYCEINIFKNTMLNELGDCLDLGQCTWPMGKAV